jgi:hypothetical protein
MWIIAAESLIATTRHGTNSAASCPASMRVGIFGAIRCRIGRSRVLAQSAFGNNRPGQVCRQYLHKNTRVVSCLGPLRAYPPLPALAPLNLAQPPGLFRFLRDLPPRASPVRFPGLPRAYPRLPALVPLNLAQPPGLFRLLRDLPPRASLVRFLGLLRLRLCPRPASLVPFPEPFRFVLRLPLPHAALPRSRRSGVATQRALTRIVGLKAGVHIPAQAPVAHRGCIQEDEQAWR